MLQSTGFQSRTQLSNWQTTGFCLFVVFHFYFLLPVLYWSKDDHVWMWELDCEESWVPKNWCFWTVVLEKSLESSLDCKEIQPRVRFLATPWTAAYQAPPSMGFSRQEYWSRVPLPSLTYQNNHSQMLGYEQFLQECEEVANHVPFVGVYILGDNLAIAIRM